MCPSADSGRPRVCTDRACTHEPIFGGNSSAGDASCRERFGCCVGYAASPGECHLGRAIAELESASRSSRHAAGAAASAERAVAMGAHHYG